MSHHENAYSAWPAADSAAKVGADPARRVAQHVEGPTLYNRELGFDRGLATFDRAPTCLGRSSHASVGAGPGQPQSLFARLRRIAPLAFVVLMALVAAGCGGGDEAVADPAANAAPATTPAPGATTPGSTVADGGEAAAGEDVPGANEIASTTAAPGSAVKISAITPKAFTAAHCKKAVLVVFYQPSSILDEALLDEARAAASQVKGIVSLTYTPRDTKKYGDLMSKLGLLSTPGLATVGRNGEIENFWTTYVDRALILRSIQNAAASRPCSVSDEDVPSAGSALEGAAELVADTSSTGAASSGAVGSNLATTDGNAVPSNVPGSSAVGTAQGVASNANSAYAGM